MYNFISIIYGRAKPAHWKNLLDSRKYRRIYGKRETFRNHEMRYPQWNDIPGTGFRVLIDENGKPIKYDVTGSNP